MDWLTMGLGTATDPRTALLALLGAFVLCQGLAFTYEATFRGVSYSRSFTQSLVLLGLGATTVVLAMGHSLVAGFGLMGVLSMVRFRSTLKSPRDLVFVLAAAGAGVASGVGALGVAVLGTSAFALAALFLHHAPFASRARYDGVLRFRTPAGAPLEPALSGVLDKHCRRRVLLGVGETGQGRSVEHAFEIELFAPAQSERLLTELREAVQATEARLLLTDAAVES